MTRRERMERRAERRREWAASRDRKAAAGFAVGNEHRDEHGRMDWALVTQPGHIPERARINRAHDRAHEHAKAAEQHRTAAAGIEAQIERSIFSDDPDAPERLAERAAKLDAAADRMRDINAAFRRVKGDNAARLAALVAAGTMTEAEAKGCAHTFALCHWERQPFPAYALANTRANARRLRERIKTIARDAETRAAAEAAPGGVLVNRSDDGTHACITFPDYPGREVVQALKAAGFWWSRPSWHGPADKIPAAVLDMVEDAARHAPEAGTDA